MSEKPKNIEEYHSWLSDKHSVEIDRRIKNHYESALQKIKRDFQKSVFWVDLKENIKKFDESYLLDSGYRLFIKIEEPIILIKPFESFIEKTYRKNILDNKNWPDPPHGDWLLPDNWYSRINDLVRTLFVVKYLDGVDFLCGEIEELAKQNNISFRKFYEAREEGYYAVHTYLKREFEIPSLNFDTRHLDVSIEIQITTQLQEVIRKLLHKYYEDKRLGKKKQKGKGWQWNHESEEFSANYLGHILHYIEGMIVEIRNKNKT